MKNAHEVQAAPAKLGSFGQEKRWQQPKPQSPGVGDYDLTGFKNFAKASETTFDLPKYLKLDQKRLVRHSRAKSAVSRTLDHRMLVINSGA